MSGNDYSVIGTVMTGFNNRFLPLERVPTFDEQSSIRSREVDDIKHKDETDIEFMESLYRNSNPDFYLGGWIVKSVIDILLEFTIGDLPTIQAKDDKYSKFCNDLINANQSSIYMLVKELGLFGQEFAYIGYDKVRKIPKIRPMSKKQIIESRYEDFNNPEDITYVRIREQLQEVVLQNVEILGEENVEYKDVFYDKIFWKELNPKYKDIFEIQTDGKNYKDVPKWIYRMRILKRVDNGQWEEYRKTSINPLGMIPIIEFNQNKMSFDKIGHSDLSGAIKIVSVYHQVLESAINNTLYNGQPTLKFTGLESDPLTFVKQMYGDISLNSGDTIASQGLYEVYGSYYLSGNADVNWLTVPETVSRSKEVLNLLFYILVQVTGVPEWALGAGMEGAWATVKQQSIPLLQKVQAKRTDIVDTLLTMLRVSLDLYNFYNNTEQIKVTDFSAQVIWGDPLKDDMETTMLLIDFMLTHNFITDEKAVSILDAIDDPLEELKKAKDALAERKAKAEADDNAETIKTLLSDKASKKASKGSKEEIQDEEVSGEMVSKITLKVVERLFGNQ